MKHTPGPWKSTPTFSHIFSNNGQGHDGVICKMPYLPSPLQWASGPADIETSANARLIAAAPELLDACKQALSDSETGNNDFERTRDMLAVAIAKAEGR